MKVTLERAALLKSLGHVHRVVERRNTIPILSNVLLRAEKGSLLLRATDLDLDITETVAADVGQPGATTLPAHVLYDIVRKLPDGAQVSLEASGDNGQLLLRSGRSRFTLQSLPESDFPDLNAADLTHRFILPAGDLKRMIDKTQFAISTEETRYYLNGIFMHTTDVGGHIMLRAVATDGHRLARIELPAPVGSGGMPGVIIPRKAVAEVQKLVDSPDRAPMGGESFNDFRERFLPWFNENTEDATRNEPVLYVGSGSNLRLIAQTLFGDADELDLDEGGLACLHKTGDTWHCEIVLGEDDTREEVS